MSPRIGRGWQIAVGILVALAASLGARIARAQTPDVPILVIEQPESKDNGGGSEFIQGFRGMSTVQEAPAILTIIPAEELVDRHARSIYESMDLVPGWLRQGIEHSEFETLNARGTNQAVLLLHDGVSLFDPGINIATVSRVVPIESIKRLEVVSGPGGVLWGANSFLGVINIITKDAEDVEGVQASVGYGDGPGDRLAMRGYAMAGLLDLFHTRASLFVHASFESYKGARFSAPNQLMSSSFPQPNAPVIFAAPLDSDPAQSMIFTFDGKLSMGNLSVYWMVPFAKRNFSLTFGHTVMRQDLPEDSDPACAQLPQ